MTLFWWHPFLPRDLLQLTSLAKNPSHKFLLLTSLTWAPLFDFVLVTSQTRAPLYDLSCWHHWPRTVPFDFFLVISLRRAPFLRPAPVDLTEKSTSKGSPDHITKQIPSLWLSFDDIFGKGRAPWSSPLDITNNKKTLMSFSCWHHWQKHLPMTFSCWHNESDPPHDFVLVASQTSFSLYAFSMVTSLTKDSL